MKVNCDWTGELRNIVYLVNVNIVFIASYNVILMIAVTFPLCQPRLAPVTCGRRWQNELCQNKVYM